MKINKCACIFANNTYDYMDCILEQYLYKIISIHKHPEDGFDQPK